MRFFLKNSKGFTIIELLVVIVLCSIILMAVYGLYLASDKVFKHTRPISDVIEEMRSAIATLDFVFSRWGIGTPCINNNCTTVGNIIINCSDFYPPSDPMCITCKNGDFSSGCKDIEFYANLYGIGFVININGTQANLISCRLTTDEDHNYYYIWQGDKVINYNGTLNPPIYKIFELSPNNQDCIKNFIVPNARSSYIVNGTSGIYYLQPGDIIMRVPHKVRIYEKYYNGGYWLYIDKLDMATGTREERPIAKLEDVNSFKVFREDRSLKLEIKFRSQSLPERTLKIEKYFAR